MKQATASLTRRDAGLALLAGTAATAAIAQQPAATEDLLASAREQVQQNSKQLREFEVPTATEPGFTFHA